MQEHPIADYAIIGNCETAALVNSGGGIDWLCLPAFDSPSFFGALVDRTKGGSFAIAPEEKADVERRYLDDSAILETRFTTRQATLKMTDFFVTARQATAKLYDFTSLHPTRKLVRLLEIEDGESVRVRADIGPEPDYGQSSPQWRSINGGFACREAAIFSNAPMAESDQGSGELSCSVTVERHRPIFFVLDYADGAKAPELQELQNWLETTRAFWKEWNYFNYYRGPYERMVRRSGTAATEQPGALPSVALLLEPGRWQDRRRRSEDGSACDPDVARAMV